MKRSLILMHGYDPKRLIGDDRNMRIESRTKALRYLDVLVPCLVVWFPIVVFFRNHIVHCSKFFAEDRIVRQLSRVGSGQGLEWSSGAEGMSEFECDCRNVGKWSVWCRTKVVWRRNSFVVGTDPNRTPSSRPKDPRG